ncbi:WecB/TagA/CpsF family glycosyltransferase [Enterococcus gallinarum]|uniref:WecB/TagA/CpsF family glycosyltransferase n=1 Tax=Enterococcus gallinarum TaxID=1353 RepID=UPI001AD66566|nr:WecB/TagA/CpsF family glycosyltransferase [Enterococcus gallinarum]
MKTDIIMGLPVDALSANDILGELPSYLNDNKKMTLVSVNPQIVTEAEKYPEVVEFIRNSTHRIPDGIGIVLVSKLTGGCISKRLAGFDLMQKLLEYANSNEKSVFFYGAKPDILQEATKKIKDTFPKLRIVGTIDGYTDLSEEDIVEKINRKAPDFLFVALGFPRQEIFLARNYKSLNVKVFQDVGGSLDVLSGRVKRAPRIFIDLHLEWLYRSVSNPRRLGRIIQLPVFLVKSIYWRFRNKNMRWTNGD